LGDKERADAVLATPRADVGDRSDDDTAFLHGIMKTQKADDWGIILNAAGVPAARVRILDEAMDHEQIASRNVLQRYPSSERTGAPNALPIAAFTFEHREPAPCGLPPTVGQHTIEILSELGYDEAQRDDLGSSGIIR
jgi:crotonobetainyl-CoA:carnitine CoA-transferase CaiB-like acyl-CoA transferase